MGGAGCIERRSAMPDEALDFDGSKRRWSARHHGLQPPLRVGIITYHDSCTTLFFALTPHPHYIGPYHSHALRILARSSSQLSHKRGPWPGSDMTSPLLHPAALHSAKYPGLHHLPSRPLFDRCSQCWLPLIRRGRWLRYTAEDLWCRIHIYT